MKLHEYQAKQVLGRFGVPVPSGKICKSPEEVADYARELGAAVVVKAQVHTGGRGKAGGVKVATGPSEARDAARHILGMTIKDLVVHQVLAEPALEISQEYYLGVVLDRATQRNAVIVSAAGGMDIEEVAESAPEKIARHWIDPIIGFRSWHAAELVKRGGLPEQLRTQAAALLQKLVRAYHEVDANMTEINPLALVGEDQLIAADGKMVIDDNALYRQPDLALLEDEAENDPIEAEARSRGIQYVRLGGNVGVIGNGAGLVMATIDEVGRAGGQPANFLDIGGGAKAELVRSSLELVLMNQNVRSVFFNIFGGITRGDEVAKGILQAQDTLEIKVPMVIRLAGTRAAEGRALLAGSSLIAAESMQEAAAEAVRLAGEA